MLATKRSAVVAAEVNLRNLLCTGDKACKRANALALKPRVDITGSPKQGYQWPHKRTYLYPPKVKKSFLNELKF